MWKYVLKRMALALLTTMIIITLSFILMKLLPFSKPLFPNKEANYGYYMSQVNDGFCYYKTFSASASPSLFGNYLDYFQDPSNSTKIVVFYQTPVMTQYFRWLGNIVTKWNWGTSTYILPNNGAIYIIAQKIPYTIKINFFSAIIAIPLGIALGILAALKKNTLADHTISTLVMIFISIPSFILITMLMLIFCYKLKVLPTQWPNDSASTAEKIKGMILPVTCLSFGSICGYCRFTRAELCEVMSSDYLLLARTKGLTKRQAILRHALRNAMVPIVPAILSEVIGLLGGSMILEQLYGIPGIGKLYVEALNAKDYNVLLVDMALFTTISLLAGVILDISYGFIDPRIRMGAKK